MYWNGKETWEVFTTGSHLSVCFDTVNFFLHGKMEIQVSLDGCSDIVKQGAKSFSAGHLLLCRLKFVVLVCLLHVTRADFPYG